LGFLVWCAASFLIWCAAIFLVSHEACRLLVPGIKPAECVGNGRSSLARALVLVVRCLQPECGCVRAGEPAVCVG